MKKTKLFKSLIIITPVLALISPLIILSNTGCGNPDSAPKKADGTDWTGYIEGALNYSFDDNTHTYTIIGNDSYVANNLVIPGAVIIDGVSYTVTAIGSHAFDGCEGLTGNLIINGVTSIGKFAFNHCYGLTGKLVIPNSMTSIGLAAFQGDANISRLSIGNNVTSIGDYAFFGCGGMTGNLVISSGVTSIGKAAFSGCGRLTGNLVIPNGVTSIGDFAFNVCVGLTGNLVIPNSVTSIGGAAFQGCIGLNSITLPDALVGLNSYACGMDLASGYNISTFKFQYFRFTNIDTADQITFADNFFGDSADIDLESKGVKIYVPNSVRDTYVTKITGISVGQKFSAENIIGYSV